jgi:hypothetical protein
VEKEYLLFSRVIVEITREMANRILTICEVLKACEFRDALALAGFASDRHLYIE